MKPLYEEAKRRIGKLGRFEMQHVLRGKNKEADRLANEAMDRGTGKGPAGRPGVARVTASSPAKPASAGASVPAAAPASRPSTPASRVQGTLPLPAQDPLKEVTGFVKNGVVHLVEGELPEGTFVRILPARRSAN